MTGKTTDAAPGGSRLGNWLPADEAALSQFRSSFAEQVKAQGLDQELNPVVKDLATLIDNDPLLRMPLPANEMELATKKLGECRALLSKAEVEPLLLECVDDDDVHHQSIPQLVRGRGDRNNGRQRSSSAACRRRARGEQA